MAAEQLEGELYGLGSIGIAAHATVAVEIGAYSHMVDAHHVDGMLQMTDGIEDGGFALGAEESGIERGMGHAASLGQGPQLVVGEVSRMVAQRPAVAVAAHDGRCGNLQRIVETLLAGMGKIDHDAAAVHLVDDLLAELAHAVVGVASTGRVAHIVVAVMAKGDIHDAALGKVLHILNIMAQRQCVLDAEHDAASALALVFVEVLGRARNAEIAAVALHDVFYLVEDGVGIGEGSDRLGLLHPRGVHLLTEGLANLGLRQIGHHGDGLLAPFLHLVHIDQDAGIALLEMDALMEEHRGVAMGVERDNAAVQVFCHVELVGLAHHPFEDGQSAVEPFGMPLHTQDAFLFGALDGLDGAVGGSCRHPEPLAGSADGLVME